MPTPLQENLAKEIVKNASRKKPLNKKQLLVASGYAEESATSVPGKLINQKGVQEALVELGFNEETAKSVVSEIMLNPNADENARLKATDQVFKVKGSYAPEKRQSLNLNVESHNVDISQFEAVRLEFEEKLKQKYIG